MADPPYSPGTGVEHAPGSSAPRWVKVFGIIAVIAILLLLGLMLFGGGRHGPGRHLG